MKYGMTLLFALVGLLVRGPQGAAIGAMIGLIFDSGRQQRQRRQPPPPGDGFVAPLFTLVGAIAKVDGRVSEAEIAIAERMMGRFGLNVEQRRLAIAAFNQGKQPEFNVTPAIQALQQWVSGRRDHAYTVMDMVIDTVLAEGSPSAAKMQILRQLTQALRISEMELMALLAMKGYVWNAGPGQGQGSRPGAGGSYAPPRRTTSGPDPYAVLGVARDADDRAIKRAYRKLISEHHPDRLGDLPGDLRQRAEARASEINAAYERIKSSRGFK
ncbi:co-chaperone DjlA [Frateuria aurantia]